MDSFEDVPFDVSSPPERLSLGDRFKLVVFGIGAVVFSSAGTYFVWAASSHR